MERSEITTSEWHAYVAGFFDGEGAIGISVAKQLVYNDEYRLRAELSQRIEYRCVLDAVCAEFGGRVTVRQTSKLNAKWSDVGIWMVIKRSEVRHFLQTLLPYLIVKRERAELAVAYLDVVENQKRRPIRTQNNSRWGGNNKLTRDELSARDVFYRRMLSLNQFGPRML